MKKQLFVLLLSICGWLVSKAQALFVPPVFNLQQIVYNPALAGSNESLSFFLSYRSHPTLRYTQAQADGFWGKQKLGIGGLLESYESLLETQNSLRLNLAYRIPTSKGFCQMGLAPILHSYRINTANLTVKDPTDGMVPSNVSQLNLNFNAGALYKSSHWFASLAMQNIVHVPASMQSYSYVIEKQLYSATLARVFSWGEGWFCQPLAYGQWSKQQGEFVALGSQLGYKSLFVGAQWGWPSSWSANVGFDYRPYASTYHLRLGYTVSSQTQGISPTWAHEVFLSIGFHKFGATPKSLETLPKYCSPVYF